MEREVVRGLDTVKQGKGIWSASLPIGEPLTSTFDIVATMVDGTELRTIADDVRESLRLDQSYNTQQDNGSYFDGPDYQLLFGSLAIIPDVAKPMCDVYVIRLQAVRDAEALVPEIIKVPGERTVPVLPPPVAPALPSSSLPSSSHKQDEDDDEQPPTQAGQNTPSDPSDGMNGSTNGPRRRGRPRGGKA